MRQNILTIILVLLVVASCDRTRTSTGWDYMPDMYYSEAYETYSPNDNFDNGLTMRTPVEGTVPRGMVPFPYEKTDEDRILAGEEMVNPVPFNQANLEAGNTAYHVFCVDCHGEQGDGKGYLFTSGRYPYPPASLVNEKVNALADGAIYHTITVGYGVMGAHGAMIPQKDRWNIIHYIREELQK